MAELNYKIVPTQKSRTLHFQQWKGDDNRLNPTAEPFPPLDNQFFADVRDSLRELTIPSIGEAVQPSTSLSSIEAEFKSKHSFQPVIESARTGVELDFLTSDSAQVHTGMRRESTAIPSRNMVGEKVATPTFKVLEHWVGRIEVISEDRLSFTAILRSTLKAIGEERAEFSVDELSDDDKELVELGAVFYWSIGYQVEFSGQRSTTSSLKFRRVPHWTRKELERAKTKASSISAWLKENRGASESY